MFFKPFSASTSFQVTGRVHDLRGLAGPGVPLETFIIFTELLTIFEKVTSSVKKLAVNC